MATTLMWLDTDRLTKTLKTRTAFDSFADLLEAKGNYRPTVHLTDVEMVYLAKAYNDCMAARGDPRRAYCRKDEAAVLPVWAGEWVTELLVASNMKGGA